MKYPSSYNPEHEAKACSTSLPISTKQSVELCSFLRNRTTEKSKQLLKQIAAKKLALPFLKYKSLPHRKGKIASGRYPIKASKYLLDIIESVEANAKQKNLTLPLRIKHISAHKGATTHHYGRHRGTKAKRTHIAIIVETVKDERKTNPKPKD